MELVKGKEYKRTDLHDFFGGQRQGGISTPTKHSVVLIFSNSSGEQYGYEDYWTDDGFFLYTGEGQKGDMKFVRGNSAIRDHEANGKELLLFSQAKRSYVTFEGKVRCVDYNYFRTPDVEGKPRGGIRFTLERADTQEAIVPKTGSTASSYRKPTATERKGLITSRVGQGYYRQQLVDKFDGRCAVTGSDLTEVLIASHILPWRRANDDERLDIENGILLSPAYDALFDHHLISFNDDGQILLSSLLREEQYHQLGIDTNASISVTEGMKHYLQWHREALR